MYGLKRFIDWFRYSLPRGVKNLIIWFPIIWKDRSWDHYFIYVNLHYKLKLTEKVIRNGHHLYRNKTADKIKICILILDRLIKDNYLDNALEKHNEKWGEGEFQFKNNEFHIKYENIKNKDDEQKQQKDFRAAVKHQNYLREQDLDILFKLLRKHIQSWWD